jgi:cell division protein FtsB
MSAVPALNLPAFRPAAPGAPEAPAPRLRPAPEPRRAARPRLAFAVTALAGIAAIVIAQLLLSVAMTEGAYEIDGYKVTQTQLAREEQKLREQIDALESPQFLAANAEALGMVPNAAPVYLRLSDGAVLGQPAAAGGAAAGAAGLVPNSLIADVPLVTQQAAGETAVETPVAPETTAGAGGGAAGGAVVTGTPAPPPVDGLPTPTTH